MNKLLINENPLLVLPSLAEKIGLNEAIVLQQVHFWISKKLHYKEGRYWVYNTYDEWLEQFPFWSKSTMRRIFGRLIDRGLIITDNFNKMKIDQTKWYSINYENLQELSKVDKPSVHNKQP